jgi:hypothetical protein
MVDRPIKKADRQNPPVEIDSTPKSSEAPNKSRSTRSGDKKGKRDSNRDEPRPPENLALMRGPKPSKTPPPIVKEVVPEVDTDPSPEVTPTDEISAQ